jgi:hypothetical protein
MLGSKVFEERRRYATPNPAAFREKAKTYRKGFARID